MPAADRRATRKLSPALAGDSAAARKPTNVTLPVRLVNEARALGVNVSQAAEAGIAEAVAREREAQWLADNRDALDSSNAYVESHGVPLSRYRNF